jgi:hypothetical protein
MGIPAAAIVDLDIITDKTFNSLLKSAFVPDTLVETWGGQRSRLQEAFGKAGLDAKKAGIEGLPDVDKEVAENLLDNVAKYGVFVVPSGELER